MEMVILFFLTLLSFTTTFADDKSAMDDFLKAFGSSPPSGWDSATDFCKWKGVNCDNGNRVTSINLASLSLKITLPSSINTLSQLTTLSLQNIELIGPLPSLANLTLLQTVFLDNNNFTSIPSGAFSGLFSLQTLSLSFNEDLAPWQFPSELTDSPSLRSFYVNNANMEGPIPDVFGSFPGLQNLRLSYNNLSGSLPGSFNGSAIQNFWVNNQVGGLLTGPIDVVSGMTQLAQVWLHANSFTGSIPDLSACTEIFDLQLRDNKFTGILPPSIVSLPELENFTINNNSIQGPLPDFPKTVEVQLRNNHFCRNVTGDCDPQVTALLNIAGALGYPIKLADAWIGNDACNSWIFVTCDSSHRVVSVNFAKQGFSGTISPAFANLTSLTELNLSNNNLNGTIPASLASLPKLKKIDLTNNDISGKVPRFSPGVILLVSGNKNIGKHVAPPGSPGSGGSSSSESGGGSKSSFIPYASVAAVVITVVVLMMFMYKCYRKKRQRIESQEEGESFSQLAPNFPVKFSYQSLMDATNNFDVKKKLGVGGFGSVFEGSLRIGTKIAVKRLDNLGQGRKEFLAEVQTIGCIHHVNLVKLVGYCAENKHRLLVYEYLSNGSLDKWIFSANPRGILRWDAKRKIILQIAKGLAYLHEECQKRIAHLDVKPQNVLLDDALNAKISDFGLAKLFDKDESYVMTQMRGTRGYLAPEWLGRKITEIADVYSYGVVVLEVVFGRKNLDYSQPEESTLIQLVKQKVEECQLFDLLNECNEDTRQNVEDVEKIIKIALWCLHTEPTRRPVMSMVVKLLEGHGGAIALEAITDYSCAILNTDGHPSIEPITQLSDSVLSGPR
ncbi:receptor-like kinase TMK4 [Chenopodium quinoa]|uniref:non-specific serine/threonine protein kinase n=1 Tax=Chenopodium quinoa TaxID=63459 RepID=A0A803LZH6_CHEQI|nr:receptor-like kinase TMK4 [Chenopodium quinoa]